MSRYDNYGRGEHRGGGGYGGGYRNYGKINEDDVPESQHSIFVRGLPASIGFEEIKNFFEEKIGPCSFDFQKVNHERNQIFVAVRFETKESAKEAYYKYREEDVLGVRCEVTWFRDIRRYISYQQQHGLQINRGGGRGGFDRRGPPGRYYPNHNRSFDRDRKRRYSDDRRSRSRSYSGSDRSGSRSRRSSRSRSHSSRRSRSITWNSEEERKRKRSRSRSLSEGERRSSSRGSDDRRPRSESREDKKRRDRKEKKVKRSRKDHRRSRRSDSESSRSGSSGSESDRDDRRERRDRRRDDDKRGGSPASSTGSPLKMTPPPAPPVIGPIFPSATTPTTTAPAPIEKQSQQPLNTSGEFEEGELSEKKSKKKRKDKKGEKRVKKETMDTMYDKSIITITNKPTVPVESTAFKMQLDTDEPPKRIIRPVRTPTPPPAPIEEGGGEDDAMDISDKDDESVQEKKTFDVDTKEKGGWRSVADNANSGPPSDVPIENVSTSTPQKSSANGPPQSTPNGDMVPRSIRNPPPASTPNPPPPKRLSVGASPLPPPPHPGRQSFGASKYPESAKITREVKAIQDKILDSVKAVPASNGLRLSELSTGVNDAQEKLEERERLINSLTDTQKDKLAMKVKSLCTSYKMDCDTFGIVCCMLLKKDPSMADQLKAALMESMEDMEKQLLLKVDAYILENLA